MDATYETGLGLASYTMSGWSVGAFDFDNDGDREVFTANSHVSENIELYRHQTYRQPNAVFVRSPSGSYQDVAPSAGPAMAVKAAHRGAAFGDLDNDGRIDAVVAVLGGEAEVLFNESDAGHWLTLDLRGKRSNRSAIGARVVLTDGSGSTQHAAVTTAVGYASASDRRVHFGLGAETAVREIRVQWPSGEIQTLADVQVDQILMVEEP